MTGPIITHKYPSPVTDTPDPNRVQPSNWNDAHDVNLGAALTALFALVPAADRLPYFTDAGTAALATFTAAARTLLAGASMSAMLTSLGGVAKAGDTMGGALTLAGDPTTGLHAATKQYVDNVAAGLDPKPSVKFATAAALATSTYSAGVLTASANGALAVDGNSPVAGDRILVKNEVAGANNGIYVVTSAGDASHPWVLTRAADMAAWTQVPGASVIVEQGTANADTGWICTADQAGAMGTTAIAWSEFFGTGVFQPNNANLSALAGLAGAADNLAYFTGANALSLTSLTAFARTLLACGNAAAVVAALNLNNASVPTGTTIWFNQSSAPAGYLIEDGASYLASAQPNLFAVLVKSGAATISIASPGVVTSPFTVKQYDPVKFTTTGALPTGITAGTTYYALSSGTSFQISTAPGGAAIVTSGTQSGTHTAINAPHGCSNDLTSFNVPNTLGEFLRAWDGGRGIDAARSFGSEQLDAMQGHKHSVTTENGVLPDGTGTFGGASSNWSPPRPINVTVGSPIGDGTNGTPRTAAETRARNVVKLPCIKT